MNKIQKTLVAATCAAVVITGSYFTSEAFFHGGPVEDIPNRIKQALETAKQGDIAVKYKELKEFREKIMTQLEGVNQIKKDIEKVIGSALGVKQYAEGVLNEGKVKKDIEAIYRIDVSKALTAEGIAEDRARLVKLQEKEGVQAAQTATDASRKSEAAVKQAEDIVNIKTNGVLAERQKMAMLQAMSVAVRNQTTMAANQNSLVNYIADADEGTERQYTGVQEQLNQFMLIPKADEETRQAEREKRLFLPR